MHFKKYINHFVVEKLDLNYDINKMAEIFSFIKFNFLQNLIELNHLKQLTNYFSANLKLELSKTDNFEQFLVIEYFFI